MTYLLDTHTLIWAIVMPEALSALAASIIDDASNTICVSAVSAWEIATKVRRGQLQEAVEFEANFMNDVVRVAGYQLRPVTVEDGLRAGRLVGEHRDPFDRMLAAQALADDIPVISLDEKLDLFLIRRIW